MDRFRIVERNLGRLYGLKVRHDNTLGLSDWFLDRVVVTDQLKKKVYTFVCGKWFSLKKGDRRIERVIREKVVRFGFQVLSLDFSKNFFFLIFTVFGFSEIDSQHIKTLVKNEKFIILEKIISRHENVL